MYIIGNIILGTHIPWDRGESKPIGDTYYRLDAINGTGFFAEKEWVVDAALTFYEQQQNPEADKEQLYLDYLEEAKKCGLPEEQGGWNSADYDWLDHHEDVWTREYHGGADELVAWCGIQLGELDETNHFPFSDLMKFPELLAGPEGSELIAQARAKYDQIPQEIRNMLPPFGIYVVWSSS